MPLLIGLACAAWPGPAGAANLFEEIGRALFGATAVRYAPAESTPLDMTVRPRRERDPRLSRPAEPARPLLQTPIDSVADARWYLRDPTLRRGDLVVTRTGVVVFEGGAAKGHTAKGHDAADFVPLQRTRLFSRARQDEIAAAAAAGRKLAIVETPRITLPAKQADAGLAR